MRELAVSIVLAGISALAGVGAIALIKIARGELVEHVPTEDNTHRYDDHGAPRAY